MSSYEQARREKFGSELRCATEKFLWLAMETGHFPPASANRPLIVARGVSPDTLGRRWRDAPAHTRQGSLLDKFNAHDQSARSFIGEPLSIRPVDDSGVALTVDGLLRAINYQRQTLLLKVEDAAKIVPYGKPYYGEGCNVPSCLPVAEITIWPREETVAVLQELTVR